MGKPKKVNERQIRHILKALKQSGYYSGSLDKKRFEINFDFLKGLQLLLLDSKGKNVQRAINAFRSVDEDFSEIDNIDHISFQVRKKIMSFLERNLSPKKFKKAEKLLDSANKPLEVGMIPVYSHPQKIKIEIEDPDSCIDPFLKKGKADGLRVDFSLNLY